MRVTCLAGLDERVRYAVIAAGHEGEHDGEVCDRFGEDVRGVADANLSLSHERQIDVFFKRISLSSCRYDVRTVSDRHGRHHAQAWTRC